jgi:hypothetical protein
MERCTCLVLVNYAIGLDGLPHLQMIEDHPSVYSTPVMCVAEISTAVDEAIQIMYSSFAREKPAADYVPIKHAVRFEFDQRQKWQYCGK